MIIHGPVEDAKHYGHTLYYDALLVPNDNHMSLKCMEFPTCNCTRTGAGSARCRTGVGIENDHDLSCLIKTGSTGLVHVALQVLLQ